MNTMMKKAGSILRPHSLAAALCCVLVALLAAPTTVDAKKYEYPPAKQEDVVDNYHGTEVRDPYRWLEDADSKETMKWVEAENKLTRKFIDGEPARKPLEDRLKELWDYPKYSLPQREGGYYFFTKNDGLQNQSVLYMQSSLDSEPFVLLDPNKLSEDGTVALRGRYFSNDGQYMAYALSGSGSDWQEVRIRNVETQVDFDDVLKWCKFAGIAWQPDAAGFYYNRFPEPGTVPEEDQNNYSRVYYHRLGTDQSEDVLVHEDPDRKEIGFWPFATDDGEYVVLYVYHGTDPRNGIYYRKMDGDGGFEKLIEVGEAKFDPINNIGSTFYFETDYEAPRGRVIAIDMTKPDRKNWKEIIAESDDVLDVSAMVNNQLVIGYMHDAHHKMNIYSPNGKLVRKIEMPTIGSISDVEGKRDDKEMFFSFTSYLFPSTAYRYDFETQKVSVFRQPEIDFDASQFETKQVFYKSKDGTKVPMFISHKKGIELNGNNPTILYGYGGFNISMTPYFSVSRVVWMESGGVFAVANLRGGDEYGEEWHRAGMLENKQNVFDDFIGAAEWLIANEYTSTERLAIEGGSNGGLLTAACMVQRPDLFGVILCRVPVIDMLRYHKFTVGRYWVPEYGNAEENPDHFEFMHAYSPLHNIKEGQAYPATLITTADTDDRVVPGHAKKFAAAVQAADAGENPILVRIETKAGHGGGKPTWKRIEEAADIYAFLFKVFGITPAVVGRSNL